MIMDSRITKSLRNNVVNTPHFNTEKVRPLKEMTTDSDTSKQLRSSIATSIIKYWLEKKIRKLSVPELLSSDELTWDKLEFIN